MKTVGLCPRCKRGEAALTGRAAIVPHTPQVLKSLTKLKIFIINLYKTLKVLSTFSKVAGVWGQSPQGL